MTDSPAPHADALLAHAGFVRCMARATLHGDGDVDDVVQETWLAALQSAPRRPGALKAWLGSIARRQAANRVRREVAWRRRDASVARRDRAPSAAEMAAQVELGRRLVDAVLELEEPYRRAILLRYYADLPPREIARQLDLPVETVRTHVKRGLHQLRGRLGHAFGEYPGGPPAALLLILGPSPTHVLPPMVGAAGGVIMANKLLVATAAIVLLLGAGIWARTDLFGRHDGRVETAPPLEVADADPGGVADPTLRGTAPEEPTVSPATTVAAPPPGSVLGRVVRKDTRAPLPGVPVYATQLRPNGVQAVTRTDGEGRFALAGFPAGEASVFALGAGWVSDGYWESRDTGYDPTSLSLPQAVGEALLLEVVPCAIVEGVVLDADGNPVAGAAVEASLHGVEHRARSQADPRVVTTGPDGTFRHDALVPHWTCDFTAGSPDHPEAVSPGLRLRPGTVNPRLTIRLPQTRWLQVAVRDAETAEGIEGVQLWACWIDALSGRTLCTEWRTDADGEVRVGPVPPDRLRLGYRCPGYLDPKEPRFVPASAAGATGDRVELLLGRGVAIRGRVVIPPDLDPEGLAVYADALTPGHASSPEVPVAEDGTFEITGLARGTYRLQATLQTPGQWYLGVAELEAPGGGVVLELRPNDGPFYEEPGPNDHRLVEVDLVVVSPSGEPLDQGWVRYFDDVAAYAVDLEEGPARLRIDGEGQGVHFEVSDLGTDEDGVPLGAGAYGPLRPVDGLLTLHIDPATAITGRVVGPDGQGVAGVQLGAILPGVQTETSGIVTDPLTECHSGPDGTFVLAGLREGAYFVKLDVPPAFATPGEVSARAGGDALVVRLQEGATVPVRVLDGAGSPVAGAQVAVASADDVHPAFSETACRTVTDASGLARITRVALGRPYQLIVTPPPDRGDELLLHSTDAWLPHAAEIRLEPGVVTSGAVCDEAGAPVAGAIVWWWEEGDPCANSTHTDESGHFRLGPTHPGTLRLRARSLPPGPQRYVPPDAENSASVEAGNQHVALVLGP